MKQHQPRPQASAIARASQRATTQQTLFNTVQHGLTSDDYYTPPWIFEKLAITFDLDVASPTGGCHWIPATTSLRSTNKRSNIKLVRQCVYEPTI
jgi:hypothetical protein